MPTAIRNMLAYAASFIMVGCGKDPGPVQVPARGTVQIISGLVIDDQGVPIAGASVRISAIKDGLMSPPIATVAECSGYLFLVDSLRLTSVEGRFVGRVAFGSATPTLCVGIEVTPPSGSGLREAAISKGGVAPSYVGTVPDTTYVTVQLRRL